MSKSNWEKISAIATNKLRLPQHRTINLIWHANNLSSKRLENIISARPSQWAKLIKTRTLEEALWRKDNIFSLPPSPLLLKCLPILAAWEGRKSKSKDLDFPAENRTTLSKSTAASAKLLRFQRMRSNVTSPRETTLSRRNLKLIRPHPRRLIAQVLVWSMNASPGLLKTSHHSLAGIEQVLLALLLKPQSKQNLDKGISTETASDRYGEAISIHQYQGPTLSEVFLMKNSHFSSPKTTDQLTTHRPLS